MSGKVQASYRNYLHILVLFLSLMNFFKQETLYSLSSLLSLIGVMAFILHITYPHLSIKVLYAWIILQIVVVMPWFDLSQGIRWTAGIDFTTASGKPGGIYINFLPLLMLAWLRPIKINSKKGKKITFYEFRESGLGNIFPLTGTITGGWRFYGNDYYTVVKPDVPFTYEGETVHHILVKRKDDEDLDPNGPKQIVYFRPVHKESGPVGDDVEAYPFEDWVYAGK